SGLALACSEEFAATAFTRSPCRVENLQFGTSQTEQTSIRKEQAIGCGTDFYRDTALAGFICVVDVSMTDRQTAGALAQLLDVDSTALEDQLIAQVRALAAAGVLLPDSAS